MMEENIEPLIPPSEPKKISGRCRKDDRKIMSGILYIFRTGSQWESIVKVYGAPSTVHDRFKESAKGGIVFD